MILDTTSKTIEVILGGAITTNQLEITADWVDTANGLTFAPGGTSLLTNGATAVTAVSSPASNVQRQVKALTIYNADTVSATVTVRMFDGTNRRRHISVTLLTGQSLVFTPESGWQALDTNANIKQSLGGTTANLTDYATGTWTPNDASGAGLVFTSASGVYTRIGNLVMVGFSVQYPSTANGSNAKIGGLPFTINGSAVSPREGNATYNVVRFDNGNTFCQPADGAGNPLLNSALSTLFVVTSCVFQKQ